MLALAVDVLSFFFFFNDTATTEIYTLSLHDALPISRRRPIPRACGRGGSRAGAPPESPGSPGSRPGPWALAPGVSPGDRKSTRLNSSHGYISYAVFCLKKKKTE